MHLFSQTNLLFYLNYLIIGEREKQANQGTASLSRASKQHKKKSLSHLSSRIMNNLLLWNFCTLNRCPEANFWHQTLPNTSSNPSITIVFKNTSSGHKTTASHHWQVRLSPIGIRRAPIIAPRAPSASVNGGDHSAPFRLFEMQKKVKIHQSVA